MDIYPGLAQRVRTDTGSVPTCGLSAELAQVPDSKSPLVIPLMTLLPINEITMIF